MPSLHCAPSVCAPFDGAPSLAVLILHGLLAGLDVLLNHELLARLPQRPDAAREELLHATREAIFAVLFLGLAWWEWHGGLAWLPAALLLTEVLISTYDGKVEGDTRVLPVPERILHPILFVNLGVLLVLLGQQAHGWHALDTGLAWRRLRRSGMDAPAHDCHKYIEQ